MHVVWDWNGTLLDDLTVVLDSVNAGVSRYLTSPVTLEQYRNHYTRPVKHFYDTLLRRELSPAEWVDLDSRFHQAYNARLHDAELALGAAEALTTVSEWGHSQSLLSMYPHDALLPLVRSRGIDHHFDQIDGLRGPAGAAKSAYLNAHLDLLDIEGPSVLMVGDTPDDAVAAFSAGAGCVLVDNGSHHRRTLEATGAEVVHSIAGVLDRLA